MDGEFRQRPFVPAGDLGPTAVLRDDAEALEQAAAFAGWLRPGACDRDRDGGIPYEALRELSRRGLLGVTVPKADGGPGVSYQTLAEMFRMIAAADPAVGQVPQNHFVFADRITRGGSADQRRFFYGELLRGARFGNALKDRGSPARDRLRTRLTPAPAGGYRLDGIKDYCTGAATAQWIPVLTLDQRDRGVLAYVGRHWPGVGADEDWHAMGQRATVSGTVRFDQVAVPAEHVISDPAAVHPRHAPLAQILHAAIDAGIAAEALADAADFVRNSTRAYPQSGLDRAADDPHLIHEFGQLTIRLHAAEELLHRAARLMDESDDSGPGSVTAATVAVAEAKVLTGEVAVEITTRLFELAGTSATDDRLNLHRHWRNARTHTLHDPARWRVHQVGDYFLNGREPLEIMPAQKDPAP